MQIHNTQSSYGSVAKTFHWLIAVIIFGLLIVGLVMTGMPNSLDKFRIFGLHKSFGITVLVLVSLRLLWKMKNVAPALPDSLSRIEKNLAHLGHAALYLLMFAMPLSGWAMSSASGFPVSVFGWFVLPDIVHPNPELRADFIYLHDTMAWVLIDMVTLHVLAALMHHFYHKNNILRRILPFVK